jgi:hypothetical protein
VNFSGNLSVNGYLIVLLLALIEWSFILLFVYCVKRFRTNFVVKLLAAGLALLAMLGAAVGQRILYQPVNTSRFTVNEFHVVVIVESAFALFILFYGMRNFWPKWNL